MPTRVRSSADGGRAAVQHAARWTTDWTVRYRRAAVAASAPDRWDGRIGETNRLRDRLEELAELAVARRSRRTGRWSTGPASRKPRDRHAALVRRDLSPRFLPAAPSTTRLSYMRGPRGPNVHVGPGSSDNGRSDPVMRARRPSPTRSWRPAAGSRRKSLDSLRPDGALATCVDAAVACRGVRPFAIFQRSWDNDGARQHSSWIGTSTWRQWRRRL